MGLERYAMTKIKASLRQAALERRASAQKGVSLIELLIAMSILTVITTMILVSWFALQNSYAYSVHSAHAREAARDAVSRMTVVIRDAQGYTNETTSVGAISVAESSKIVFTTSYAQTGGANVGSTPVLSGFIFIPPTPPTGTGKIYSVRDENTSGSVDDEIANISNGQLGQYGRLVVDNVVNNSATSPPTSLFSYTYFDSLGTLHPAATSLSSADVKYIYSVQIHCLVDLNPGRSPVYMDLQTTAQPRNMRPST
jgi:prepilin-type N-terminal cleavage/methylation domain-containing protein